MSFLLNFLVFFPMLMAVVIYCRAFKSEKANNFIIIFTTVAELAGVCVLYGFSKSEVTLDFFCSFGITFTFGSFRTVMATITTFVWLAGMLFARDWFDSVENNKRFYAFALLVLGATLGVFFSKDFMTMFMFFEIMSLTSYVWVAHAEDDASKKAAPTYLYIGIIGGLSMLTGIILLYSICGTLDFNVIYGSAKTYPVRIRTIAGICMLVGFGAKAGMFPLHVWMPRSYPAAPTPGTILLSGVLSKCGVFGITLLSCWLLGGVKVWGTTLLVLAVATMFFGALLALFSTDMKRTIACSSMSQVGFILVALSMLVLSGQSNLMGVSGTILHVLNHSLIKTCLFIICGVVYMINKSTDLNEIKGSCRNKPFFMICFILVTCSIAGIPGFSGYISKTLMHESIVEYIEILEHYGRPVAIYKFSEIMFLVSGGLTFAYMTRLFYILFIAKNEKHKNCESALNYISVPVGIVLGITALSMLIMGLTPHKTMDSIAHYSASFFLRSSAYDVKYFSTANLKGAFISICIGIAVLLLIGMKFLTRKTNDGEVYLDRWPKWLDIEYLVYRPLLSILALLGATIARAYETLSALLVLGPVNIIFHNAEAEWIPHQDNNFNVYSKKNKISIVRESFSYDLILACVGIAVFLIFILIRVSIIF